MIPEQRPDDPQPGQASAEVPSPALSCIENAQSESCPTHLTKDELISRAQQLAVLLRVSRELSEVLEIPIVLRRLIAAGMELTGGTSGAAGLMQDGSMVFTEYNKHGELVPVHYGFPIDHGVPGWVVRHRQPYLSNDAVHDPRVVPEIQRIFGFGKLIDVPIISRNHKLLGCFEIHDKPEPFGQHDVELLQSLAASAAVAIENARMLAESRKTERALQEAEGKYRSLVENSPVGVYIAQDNRFLYANPRLAEMLGYTEQELLHQVRIADAIAPHDRERVYRNLQRRIAGENAEEHYGFQAMRKDGTLIDVEVYGTRTVIGGQPAAQGMLVDVSEQKRGEQALREGEEKFRILAESASAAIGIIQDSRFAYVNPYLEQASGYSHDELLSMNVGQLVHPDDRPMVMDNLRRRLRGEALVSHYEYRMITKTGQQRWMEISPARIEYKGHPAVVGIAYDVSDRKVATEALRRSEEKYRQLVEEISDWVWAVDPEGRYTYASPAVERILGYTPEEVLGKTAFDLMIPEDREAIRSTFEEAVRERREITNVLNRNLRKDGQVRYLETSGRPVIDDSGNLVGYRGVDRDITERMLAVNALRLSEMRFRTMFEDGPAPMLVADTNGRITQANDAFLQLNRLSRDEVVGRTLYETVLSPEDMDRAREVAEKLARGEKVTNTEWHSRRPDGGDVYVLTSIAPLYDDRGRIEGSIAIGTDITDRKLGEERARELEEHKRDFYRRTIMAATEGKLIITEHEEICEHAGDCLGVWHITGGEQLSAVREEVTRIARSEGMDRDRTYDFVLSVGEAMTNAIKHANGGDASLHRSDDSLLFVVVDHGKGIEALALPEVALKRGYTTAVSLGMGYKAMISISDRVYLDTGPEGTTVGVEMRLHAVPEPMATAGFPDAWRTGL